MNEQKQKFWDECNLKELSTAICHSIYQFTCINLNFFTHCLIAYLATHKSRNLGVTLLKSSEIETFKILTHSLIVYKGVTDHAKSKSGYDFDLGLLFHCHFGCFCRKPGKSPKTSESDYKSNTPLQSCIHYNMPWLRCRRNPLLPHHWWTWTLSLQIQVWNWSQLITDLNLIGNFPKLWRMFWLSKTSELNRSVDAQFSRIVNSMAHDIHFALYLKRIFNRVADDRNPFYATLSTLQDENINGT